MKVDDFLEFQVFDWHRQQRSKVAWLQVPWRWDWRPGEHQVNGAGLCNCSSVAPGVPTERPLLQDPRPASRRALGHDSVGGTGTEHSTSKKSAGAQNAQRLPPLAGPSRGGGRQKQEDGHDDDVCCFPYLTGNAVFPACTSAGLGFYHLVDLQHVLRDPEHSGLEAGFRIKHSSGNMHQWHPNVTVISLEQHELTGQLSSTQVTTPSGL
jgi:hypothetical protein